MRPNLSSRRGEVGSEGVAHYSAARFERSLSTRSNRMADGPLDVVGVGNAIVDVFSHTDYAFLTRVGLEKGVMTLIDAARAEELYAQMGPGVEMSGGSAGNTMAGLASLGATGAFIGRVHDDQLGKIGRASCREKE